jgi:hypothetical protein
VTLLSHAARSKGVLQKKSGQTIEEYYLEHKKVDPRPSIGRSFSNIDTFVVFFLRTGRHPIVHPHPFYFQNQAAALEFLRRGDGMLILKPRNRMNAALGSAARSSHRMCPGT